MPQEAILSIAGILTGLGVIFVALITIYKIARRLDAAIGVDKEGRTIADRLDRVEHQLWENGGNSLADRVNQLREESRQTNTEVIFMKDVLLTMLGQQTPAPQKRKRGGAGAPVFGLQTINNDDE
jgi:hypothetical protein